MSCSGESLTQSSKGNRRTLDTPKAIVAYGGREVAIDHLSVVLWPDADGDSAEGVLDMAIHRLHKLFDNADAIAVSSGKVGFNMYLYGLDLQTFQAHRQIIPDLVEAPDPGSNMLLTAALDMLAAYIGDFLADEVE